MADESRPPTHVSIVRKTKDGGTSRSVPMPMTTEEGRNAILAARDEAITTHLTGMPGKDPKTGKQRKATGFQGRVSFAPSYGAVVGEDPTFGRPTQRGTDSRGLQLMTSLLGARMPTESELQVGASGIMRAYPRGEAPSGADINNRVRVESLSPSVNEKGKVVKGDPSAFGQSGRPTLPEVRQSILRAARPTARPVDPSRTGIITPSSERPTSEWRAGEQARGSIGEFSPIGPLGNDAVRLGAMYEHILRVQGSVQRLMQPKGEQGGGLGRKGRVNMPDMGMSTGGPGGRPYIVGGTREIQVSPAEMDSWVANEADRRKRGKSNRRKNTSENWWFMGEGDA